MVLVVFQYVEIEYFLLIFKPATQIGGSLKGPLKENCIL